MELHHIILFVVGFIGCFYALYSSGIRIMKKEISKEVENQLSKKDTSDIESFGNISRK